MTPHEAPATEGTSRLLAFLRQPLTRVQALVGISAGSLTIIPVSAVSARKATEPGTIRRFFQNLGL